MNEQLIHNETNNKSAFYLLAIDPLDKECTRLSELTDALDKDAVQKKENIASYKCTKYRYASVARIYNLLYHGYRVYHRPAIHLDIESCIQSCPELSLLCNQADGNERIDCKLYYGISCIAKEMNETYSQKLIYATDWEKVELEERINGLNFAIECLNEAWEKRKEVIE